MERAELNPARVSVVGLGGAFCAWMTGGAEYWKENSAEHPHRCSSRRCCQKRLRSIKPSIYYNAIKPTALESCVFLSLGTTPLGA